MKTICPLSKFVPILAANFIFIVLRGKKSKKKIFYMVKIRDGFLFHIFQAILCIDYLKCLKLWEGVGPAMHEFKCYKISRKKRPYVIYVVVTILSSTPFCHLYKEISPNLWDYVKTILTFICYLVSKLLEI